MKPWQILVAGVLVGIAVSTGVSRFRPPEQSGALTRMDSLRLEAENRAARAEAERDSAKAHTEARVAHLADSVAASQERERQAHQEATQAQQDAQTSGAKVAGLLDSLGASTEAWEEHLAADSAVTTALETERDEAKAQAAYWETQAFLWMRQNTVTEGTLKAERDAHSRANTQLVEAMERLGIAERRAERAERAAAVWKVVGLAGGGTALVQAVVH